nr:hypothetical protein [Tanacetum cinerariifolium]
MKKALKKSKRETHKLLASGSSERADFESEVPDEPTGKPKGTSEGTGKKPGVLDMSKDDFTNSEAGYWGNSEEESDDINDKDDNDDENEEDDDGGNDDGEDDDVAKELYGDLNITQGLRDTNMTNAEQGGEDQQNASHKSGFKQEEDDGHVTLTTVHDKTEGTMQSSFVSSDFTSKLLNLDNTGPDVNEIASLMNTSTVPPPPLHVNPSSHLTTISQQQTPDSTTKITNKTMTLPEIPNFTSLFQFDQKGYFASKVKEAVDIRPKDEKRNSSKDAEPSKGSKSSSSSKGTQSQPKSLSKSTQAEEPNFNTTDTEMQQDQGNESGHIDDQIDNKAAPKHDWFQKLSKPQTPDHAWNKSKSIDFRLPQKWISTITKARQPPHTFNELMGTPIDFSAYVMNRLKIDNLT